MVVNNFSRVETVSLAGQCKAKMTNLKTKAIRTKSLGHPEALIGRGIVLYARQLVDRDKIVQIYLAGRLLLFKTLPNSTVHE